MRIGIDFRMGGSINSGIGRYIFELLRALLTIDANNHYIVFYNKNNVSQEDLHTLSTSGKATLIPTTIRHYSVKEQLLLPKILNEHALDLMHFPNFNVPVLYKGSYVATIHDMVHHKISGHKKSRALHFQAYKYIMAKAVRGAKAILTPSEAAKQDIVQYFPESESKIHVVHEAPSLEPQSEQHVAEVKQTFLLSRPYFLFVGTLERKKNILALAHGFNEFLEKYKLDMDMVFAGKPDSHYPEEKFKALGIKHSHRLVFTGFVTDAELAALYQGAYAFVSASLNEGFGIPGVEAMQFGLPLLVANTAVFNEVYDQAAIYFDPHNPQDIAEKMNLLATDRQFYQQQQQKSLNRGLQFSWQDAAKQTLAVYESVVGTVGPEQVAELEEEH